jgi:predicted house-cleaning noncanonical NTP pyrophosphatase (MazG superfamily)
MKLVRSGLVGKRENRTYEQVGGERFTTLLIHKAYEELHEVAEQMLLPDPDVDNLTAELGDLIEVICTIADWFELDMETVEDARNAKLEDRGGFTQRWVIL